METPNNLPLDLTLRDLERTILEKAYCCYHLEGDYFNIVLRKQETFVGTITGKMYKSSTHNPKFHSAMTLFQNTWRFCFPIMVLR